MNFFDRISDFMEEWWPAVLFVLVILVLAVAPILLYSLDFSWLILTLPLSATIMLIVCLLVPDADDGWH